MNARARFAAMTARLALPAVCAPMFLVSGPDMVIEACRAGVMGSFPATNARTLEDLRAWLERISTEVGEGHAPWALNMIVHSSYGRFDDELALAREFRPEIVITALGGPQRVVEAAHGWGGLVFADVNSPSYARKAVERGADGLVLVCAGAGGHTGEYAMAPFIEEVRAFFDGPLMVGGGLGTGAAVRAARVLGADLAYMGTRFLATEESLISDAYRRMARESGMEDLIASRAITGALGNWMRASVERAGLSEADMRAEARMNFSSDMHSDAKAWKNVWSAGQGVGAVTRRETVAEVVAALAEGYAAAG